MLRGISGRVAKFLAIKPTHLSHDPQLQRPMMISDNMDAHEATSVILGAAKNMNPTQLCECKNVTPQGFYFRNRNIIGKYFPHPLGFLVQK